MSDEFTEEDLEVDAVYDAGAEAGTNDALRFGSARSSFGRTANPYPEKSWKSETWGHAYKHAFAAENQK